MSVLTSCQDAAVELNQSVPDSLFSTTDDFAREMRLQADRTATAVLKAYDWQKQMVVHTLTGDGTTTTFSLPDDYDRLPKDTDLLTSSFGWKLNKARDQNQWLDFQINTPVAGPPGYWIIIGGLIGIRPALAIGDTVKFYYIKNTMITGAASVQRTAFAADGDTFNLPERLISLGVVWRWRASKRMEYAEDLENYNIAFSEEVGSDKGSRVLVAGRRRLPGNIAESYPGPLGS